MSEQTMQCWNDDEREEGVLTHVESGTTGYSVTSSSGWGCLVSAEYGVVPSVGDHFTTWGRIGQSIRGMAVNRKILFYRTHSEQRIEDAKRADRMLAERIADYESTRSDFDARVSALPTPLRERIEQFRAFKGDAWRWQFEQYEMACCEEAARLATHFTTGDAIKAFSELDYAEQRAAYPQMDAGHSGNTWSVSLRLAYQLCEEPELVPKIHAAMCPLAGCDEAGCFAVRPENPHV